MLEMHLNVGKKSSGGVGYFIEELSNEQFTTYANVTSLAGVTQGSAHNEGEGWLKFEIDGKELIISKKTIRYTISWRHLNDRDCVFGNKVITINGNQYKLRLLKGADSNPTNLVNPGHGNYLNGSHNSEWSRLFYPIVKDDINLPLDIRNLDAPYTNIQLGMGDGNGRTSWCQETHQDNLQNWRVHRGYAGASSLSRHETTQATAIYGWRPCLELIRSHEAPEIQVASYHNPEDFEMAPSNLHHTYYSDPNTL